MWRLLSSLLILTLSTAAWAQNRTVTGTVTDSADGSALPGVSVLVQGTTKGVPTDLSGAYTLQLAPGENIITFSFIGYKTQTVTVGEQTTIDVKLESDATELTEVVAPVMSLFFCSP